MFNIISYLIFLAAASYITIDVGRRCYHEGKFYLEYLIHDKNLPYDQPDTSRLLLSD